MLFLAVWLQQSPVENTAEVSCRSQRGEDNKLALVHQSIRGPATVFTGPIITLGFSQPWTMRNPQSCLRCGQRNNAVGIFLFPSLPLFLSLCLAIWEEIFPEWTCMQCTRRVKQLYCEVVLGGVRFLFLLWTTTSERTIKLNLIHSESRIWFIYGFEPV